MASRRKKNIMEAVAVFSFLFSCFSISIVATDSERTATKIYIDLKAQSSCIRQLNATHQLGCTSSKSGNVGIVHYVQSSHDMDWILSHGPHPPYIAVLDREDFNGTIADMLREQPDRVNGIMVINLPNSTYPSEGFSAEDSCPNDQSGLYRNSSEYGSCQKTVWNPAGSAFVHQEFDFPIFSLTDEEDVDNVLNQCFFKFNVIEGTSLPKEGFPLCSAEMSSFMNGAVDSVTCLRRSSMFQISMGVYELYCDPMQGRNVHFTLLDTPNNETRPPDSVILVGARIDSTSPFYNEYWAADTSVTGFVGILAAIEVLWKVADTMKATPGAKDILFSLFNGETYDYIGSSSVIQLMNKGNFPQEADSSSLLLQSIELKHINHIVELNQVGRRDNDDSLWLHTDPDNYQAMETRIDNIIGGLQNVSLDLNVTFQQADAAQPLPPASAQRFLMGRGDIPTVVITDHQAEFTNNLYNSHLDKAEQIQAANYPPGLSEEEKYNYVTQQAQQLSQLSSALARYLFQASTGLELNESLKETLTADSSTVTHLLYCFLINPQCELFFQSVSTSNLAALQEALQPFPLYIGVDQGSSPVFQLLMSLAARYTGKEVDLSESDCEAPSNDQRYSYRFMLGNQSADGSSSEGWCMKSLVHYSTAISPAFSLEDYDMKSGLYSTWTESRWGGTAFSVRLFLSPSREMQVSLLGTGVGLLVLSLLLAYWLSEQSGNIFMPRHVTIGADVADTTSISPMI